MNRKWKCTVCGYGEEGTEPPSRCPRCGADGNRFIPGEASKFYLPRDLADSFLVHAVAAHFPNGLLPSAVLFLILDYLLGDSRFETAAFFLLVLSLAAIPVSLASGIYDWKKRYGGVRARIFYKKIFLAVALFVLSAAAAGLRYSFPESSCALKKVYSALMGLSLTVAVLLGHYGGKLAFQWRNRKY
jgi:uncharacterized membrane protein